MNLSDYKRKVELDPEYAKAREELAPRFELANAIIRARIRRGWSQKDLADAIGTKQANISRIEASLGNPTFSIILKLLQVLNLDLKITPKQVSVAQFSQNNSNQTVESNFISVSNWPGHPCEPNFTTKSNSRTRKEQAE